MAQDTSRPRAPHQTRPRFSQAAVLPTSERVSVEPLVPDHRGRQMAARREAGPLAQGHKGMPLRHQARNAAG
jgi:hypothetical protein